MCVCVCVCVYLEEEEEKGPRFQEGGKEELRECAKAKIFFGLRVYRIHFSTDEDGKRKLKKGCVSCVRG